MKFYTTEKLGPKQSLTPEGFLLCEDVPIARTGTMIYGPGETPIDVGPDGIAKIEREPEQVFRPETIASINGKPVVDEHPEKDVDPENWRQLAVGVGINPRRGAGAMDDLLIADLLITDKDIIPLVRDGKREISLGYDADYEEIAPGRGRQKNILVNHIALVESGRCGPRCAIGDHAAPITVKENQMTLRERIKNAFKQKDEGALTAVLDELPEEEKEKDGVTLHTHVHVHDDDMRDDKKKGRDAEKEDEEEEEKEEKKKTTDARLKKVEDDVKSMKDDVKAIKDRVMKDADEEEEEEEKEKKDKAKDNEKIEGSLEEEAPPGTGDRARKAHDSAYLEDSFQETVALAEVIAPGVGIPTFDMKAEPKKTYDAICKFRRSVLDLAYGQPETRVFMDEVLGGHELSALPCGKVRDVFRSVGAFKKRANNDQHRGGSLDASSWSSGTFGSIRTPADLNKRMSEIYSKQ